MTRGAYRASGARRRSVFTGNVWYVSKSGSNASGTSWTSAWNELNQIVWASVAAGDVILIDGGSVSMTYTTALNITKSGTAGSPITIRLSATSGHNGQAIFFGGRTTLLPNSGSTSYTYQTAGVLTSLVQFNGNSYVTLDGTYWHGIAVTGCNGIGLQSTTGASNLIVRNVEIFDCGTAALTAGTWDTDLPGARPIGTNITYDRMDIYDNGQDCMQQGGGLNNFTMTRSWLHNHRSNPLVNAGSSWNLPGEHTDGLQVYSGGNQSAYLFSECVFGPGLMDALILGQTLSGGNQAEVDNVTVQDSLVIDCGNGLMGYPAVPSANWTITNNTLYCAPATAWDNTTCSHIILDGNGHVISDNVLYKGNVSLSGTVTGSGNCQFSMTGNTTKVVGQTADPQFTTDVSGYVNTTALTTLEATDFTLKGTSPCLGKGAPLITSTAALIAANNTAPVPPDPGTPPVVAEDASTPAVVQTAAAFTSATITTASFTPPAGSLLLVMASLAYASAYTTAPTLSVAATGVTFTQLFQGGDAGRLFNLGGCWYAHLPTSPGPITVTLTRDNTAAAGGLLAVRVLNNAAASANLLLGGIQTGSSAESQASVNPSQVGSLIYAANASDSNGGLTAVSGMTDLANWNDSTDAVSLSIGKSTALTTSTSAATVGWTWGGSTGSDSLVQVVEVPPTPTPPTLVAVYGNDNTGSVPPHTASALSTSVTVQSGDLVVVLAGTQSATDTLGTPSGGGLTYALQASNTTGGTSPGYGWTALATSNQTFTLTMTPSTLCYFNWNVYVFRKHGGVGAVTAQHFTSTQTFSLTTQQAHSAVAWLDVDFNDPASPATPVYSVPTSPLFSANIETGDMSQFPSYLHSAWDSGDAESQASTTHAHAGTYGIQSRTNTTLGTSATRVPVESIGGSLQPNESYFSTWLYLPSVVTLSGTFHNVTQWKRATFPYGTGSDPVFTVNQGNRAGSGNMYLYAYHHVGTDGTYNSAGQGIVATAPIDLPTGRWVHLESFYRWSTQHTGEFFMWQDGTPIWALTGMITEYNYGVDDPRMRQWSINNYSDGLTPAEYFLWWDDVIIGPTAGAFIEEMREFVGSGQVGLYGGYHPDAGAAGAKTLGTTAPSGQAPTYVAIEILPA